MAASNTDFMDQLDSVGRLPTPPGVVAQLLEVTRRPDATAREVTQVVAGDPVMSAKILRFINSPMAGVNREVTSLQQAVALLGMNSVKMMALSFAVVSSSSAVPCPGFEPQHFAAFSAVCGTASRHLAERLNLPSPSEAFTAGLLSQYGRFVFASVKPEEYAKLLARSQRAPHDLPVLEHEAFGETYATIGAQLLRRWGLPESLCGIIAAFRDDAPASEGSAAVTVVALAEEAASVVCPNTVGAETDPEPFLNLAEQCFGLSQDDCTDILTAISEEAHQMCVMLEVPTVRVRSATDIEQQVRDRIAELGVALHMENQNLARQQEDLRKRATTDALTGIGNRAAFDARLEVEMERAIRSGAGFALVMFDVDHFKLFNDEYGHQAGDCVLKAVATALDGNVRKVDYAARYGGEEFAVIAPDTNPEAAMHLAERLRSVVSASRVQWDGHTLSVTVSAGVAVYSELPREATPEDVIRGADQQLYVAKCDGRNVVRMMLNGQAMKFISQTA